MNNASLAEGKLLYYFTNLSTGKKEGNSSYIDLVNGTFKIEQESFSPSTDYSFTIIEVEGNSEKQYFQRTFRTEELGISLEKLYATSSSLGYQVNFSENTDVAKAWVSICVKVVDPETNEKVCSDDPKYVIPVSKEEIGKEIPFTDLESNTTYAVSISGVEINKGSYSNVYDINRKDTTLKETPNISGINVEANAEEVRFDIKLNDFYPESEFANKQMEYMKKTYKNETENAENELNKYLKENKLNPIRTESGLYYLQTKSGNGENPQVGTQVKVHYTGKLLDGTVFDSSISRNEPIQFDLGVGQVIPGWDEGIRLMSKGEKGILFIPYYLGYGDRGAGAIPPFATLIFDVELVDF